MATIKNDTKRATEETIDDFESQTDSYLING
eukprot:CAMPEP_0172486530 /NCGR_PEP_ID=MMETSP1066-20121228/15148_1 /TAXON_ID=671091 /ORGANISM="Coscinodiscus wailesii, Strain CCMP2513" /LENGTH=30 /DNA_ID= /DNA_START= /DNA_END= /DNA_ORIENTATION=